MPARRPIEATVSAGLLGCSLICCCIFSAIVGIPLDGVGGAVRITTELERLFNIDLMRFVPSGLLQFWLGLVGNMGGVPSTFLTAACCSLPCTLPFIVIVATTLWRRRKYV